MGARRGPGARTKSTRTNFRKREKLFAEDTRELREACGFLFTSRSAPQLPERREARAPRGQGRGPRRGKRGEARGPTRAPPAARLRAGRRGGPYPARPRGAAPGTPARGPSEPRTGARARAKEAGRQVPAASRASAGGSRGPKPTAAALSPSRRARRRKGAAPRPRPRPRPGPGPARPSRRLPPARCSRCLPPPLPGPLPLALLDPRFVGEPRLEDSLARPGQNPLGTSGSASPPQSYFIPGPKRVLRPE